MEKDRNTLVLYSDAVCNLKCRYCFIDKNPALLQIDALLDESFKGDYYFEFAKKVFPDPMQLHEIQIWGGEPTLEIERTFHTIRKLIEYYPRLDAFMMSTNATMDDWIDKLYSLFDVICEHEDRKFLFNLQLSIDGPTPINDLNRGTGVTEKFTKNFIKLVTTIDGYLDKHPNLEINAHFKPTLDNSSIEWLQTKERVLDYYKFFNHYMQIAGRVFSERFSFAQAVPNTAVPSPHTKEDGIRFANLCRFTREIEKENSENRILSHYTNITPYADVLSGVNADTKDINYCNSGACGSGKCVLGLLPGNTISGCHNGFTQLLEDYKKYCAQHTANDENITIDESLFSSNTIQNDMVFPLSHLKDYEEQVEEFYDPEAKCQVNNVIMEIIFLARTGLIDEKYTRKEEAIRGAKFILSHTSYCMRDNLGTTGCKAIIPTGLIKLLLNGAIDIIEEE